MDLNRVTVIGRLTRDPEVRTTPNGQTVATMTVATNFVWTDQAGAKQERSEFHNCVVWRKLAEIVGQYLSKGRRVYVEGRLQTRDWIGQDGIKRYRTEIVVENMIMLDGPRTSTPGSSTPPASSGAPQEAQEESYIPISNAIPPKEEEIKVEDIPF